MAKKMTDEQKCMLFWTSGPGDKNRMLAGKSPCPDKKETATRESWHDLQEMPLKCGHLKLNVFVNENDMRALEMGHIPEAMEDHWFMYCDGAAIRYYRSWTGILVFEAHYEKTDEGYMITDLIVNLDCESDPMGPMSAFNLFMCLCAADADADWCYYWDEYVKSLEKGE